jgi:diaminopimelate epimerase
VAEPSLYSAAGNRFAVLDAFERLPARPAELARGLCGRLYLDGLLLAARPAQGGDVRMLVFNRDGSRAEACGNGLRALARWAFESEHAGADLVIETDSGPRAVHCSVRAGKVLEARAELGVPRIVERDARIDVEGEEIAATLVDMGNPHCVVPVPDLSRVRLATLGAALERHPRFPHGVNVSFAELAGRRLLVRTWERGVGETAAGGTGVGATPAAAHLHGRVRSPVEVGTRGARLVVEWDGVGTLWLAGPVEALPPA